MDLCKFPLCKCYISEKKRKEKKRIFFDVAANPEWTHIQ